MISTLGLIFSELFCAGRPGAGGAVSDIFTRCLYDTLPDMPEGCAQSHSFPGAGAYGASRGRAAIFTAFDILRDIAGQEPKGPSYLTWVNTSSCARTAPLAVRSHLISILSVLASCVGCAQSQGY
jgi:hypothetical protein